MSDPRPITVSVPFSIDNGDGTNYSDALIFTLEERAQFSDADIEAIQAGTHPLAVERYENWKAHVAAASAAPADEATTSSVNVEGAIAAAQAAVDAAQTALDAARAAQAAATADPAPIVEGDTPPPDDAVPAPDAPADGQPAP